LNSLPNKEKTDKWAKELMRRLEKALETDDDIAKISFKGREKNTYLVLKHNLQNTIDFGKYMMSNGNVKPYSMARIINYLIYFMSFIGKKSIENINREDIEAYLNNRVEKGYSERYMFMLKLSVRSFFKWFYKYEDGYPDVVAWMKCKLPKNKKLPQFIEMSEIQKMLEACDNIRDKTLISILYESGTRISELLDLRIQDIKFDQYGAILHVDGKTGGRPVRVVRSTNDLKQWLNSHPFKNDTNAPLFCSLSGRNYGGFIVSTAGWEMIRKIAKRAGIQRGIHPHMFRHSRATDLSRVLSDREMKIFFGWSANSNMPGLYSHLNSKDVDDKILVMNGEKPKGELQPSNLPTFKCYRCSEANNASNKFCFKCFAPLEMETVNQVEQLKVYINEFLTSKLLQKPGFMEELPKLVEEWSKDRK